MVLTCSQQQALKPTHESNLPPQDLITLEYAQQLERNAANAINETQLLLQAAYIYARIGESRPLYSILSALEGNELNKTEQIIFTITKAELANLNFQAENALKQLNSIERIENFDIELQSFFTDTKSKSYMLLGENIESARERVFIHPILPDSKKENNSQQIWLAVSKLNMEELKTALNNETEPSLKGWIELAHINKAFSQNLEIQNQKFKQWADTNPNHEANQFMPGSIKAIKLALKNKPKKIVLLLPESGPYEKSAAAIKQGFLFNYYLASSRNSEMPELLFLDTSEEILKEKFQSLTRENKEESSTDITNEQTYSESPLNNVTEEKITHTESEKGFLLTYQEALSFSPDLIIGPINKNFIELLHTNKTDKIPNLALNYFDNTGTETSSKHLFQFGLAPEHDIDFVVKQTSKKNFHNAAILAPDNEWGERLSSNFTMQWESSGGKVVSSAKYSDTRGLTKTIETMLNIDLSEQRFKRLYWYSEGKTLFYSRRRQDIDFIFLIGSPEMARQIMPTFAFHDASDLPVYSISNIYSGKYNNKDKDMGHLIFSEIPSIINPDSTSMSAWTGQDFRYKRLIAMGMDSYDIANRLSILKASKDNVLFGKTGNLSMDEHNNIKREPVFAKFQNSKIVLQPSL